MMTACVTKETALEAGLRFTAIGSFTAIGVELSLSGGSFFGKSTSTTLAKSVFQIGSSTIESRPAKCKAGSRASLSRFVSGTRFGDVKTVFPKCPRRASPPGFS